MEEIRKIIKEITGKLGIDILTEAELSNELLNRVFLPYLREKMGFLADAKLERRIKKGRYDARIGSLIIEFERPKRGIREGISQAKGYIKEFKEKNEVVKCFVTDGILATFVDEYGREGPIKTLIDIVPELIENLAVLSLMPCEPEDLLKVLGPTSDICRSHVKRFLEMFQQYRSLPFVNECFDLWRRVYGAAANLTPDVIRAVQKYAANMDIELKDRQDVEEFLFIIETYLSILMKLLVASVAVTRRLVEAPRLSELLLPPLESFEKLSDKIPFFGKAFEHDAFSWFIDITRRDKASSRAVTEIIQNLSLALDRLDLSKVQIDLLRRLYQQFFDAETRKALGEFYTNEEIVNEILDGVGYHGEYILDKRLLDMSCGSGTFLIVAIRRFIEAGKQKGLSNTEILERLQTGILGIDIHPFAVAMARVNYLLAISELIDATVRRVLGKFIIPIYWTDSLAGFRKRPEPTGIPIIEVDVSPLGTFNLPDHSELDWDYLIDITKKAVIENWEENRYLQEFSEDVVLKYKDTLLSFLRKFKKRASEGRDSRWLSTLRNVIIVDKLMGQCDFVVGNPPWVRIHNVDEQLRKRIAEKYAFYGKKAGWNPRLKKTRIPFREQVDYSIAFVEAALRYLKEGGFFGFVITSNVVRSLYAGAMRNKLLQDTKLLQIIDYSLTKVELFEGAQNAPLIIIFQKIRPEKEHKVKMKLINRLDQSIYWEIEQAALPLYKDDLYSPWIMVPPEVLSVIRKMQSAGPRLGDVFLLSMGIKTAANDVFFVEDFELADRPNLVIAFTKKGKVRIEHEVLRPILRGRDIDAWLYAPQGYIIWTHDDNNGKVLPKLPPNAENYFNQQHIKRILVKRSDYRKGYPPWIIFRVSQDKLNDKVAWQMIARYIEAAYIPAEFDDKRLGKRKLIVDHSVYFVNAEDCALEIAGLLNSTPARVYASAFVNRTGAVYLQFFAWIIGLIPIPKTIILGKAKNIADISRQLHEVKGNNPSLVEKLDKEIAKLYGISNAELHNVKTFFKFFSAG